jgi:hypothetical protein
VWGRRRITKFRVLLLKLRKPKENNVGGAKNANRFLIKFHVDKATLVSLFMCNNSSCTSDDADRPI